MKKISTSLTLLILGFTFIYSNVVFAVTNSTFPDTKYAYEEAIEFLASRNIVQGYPDGHFKPFNFVNRAEIIKMVFNGGAETLEPEKCFPDVNEEDWFSPYVCEGKRRGYVKGYPDGTFKPSQKVNFVEAVKILTLAYDLPYEEADTIWYESAVRNASSMNIIPLNISSFDYEMNRAEISEMITRLIKNIEGTIDEYLGQKANLRLTYEQIAAKWEKILEIPDLPFVRDLVVHPGNSNLLLSTEGDVNIEGISVYYSEDGGLTWEQTFEGFRNDEEVRNIALDQNNPNIVYMSTHLISEEKGILYKSIDFGLSWNKVADLEDSTRNIIVDKNDSNKIYVLLHGASGINISEDGGLTWSHYSFGMTTPYDSLIPWSFAQDKSNNYIYIGAETTQTVNEKRSEDYHPPILRSADGGYTWENIYPENDWHIIDIVIDDSNDTIYFFQEGYKFLVSYDDGESVIQGANVQGIVMGAQVSHIINDEIIIGNLSGGIYELKPAWEGFYDVYIDENTVQIGEDLGNPISDIDFVEGSNMIFVSTYGGGIYKYQKITN